MTPILIALPSLIASQNCKNSYPTTWRARWDAKNSIRRGFIALCLLIRCLQFLDIIEYTLFKDFAS
jgi:hypothetical protein